MQGEETHAQPADSLVNRVNAHQLAQSVGDTAKRTRRTRADMEKEFYDVFAKWARADRAMALKVLTTLHDNLPDNPRKPEADPPG